MAAGESGRGFVGDLMGEAVVGVVVDFGKSHWE
jgi:hypothetical protein